MPTTDTKTAAMHRVKMIAARFERANAVSLSFLTGEVRRSMLWVQVAGPRRSRMTADRPGFAESIGALAAAFLEYVASNDFYAE